ncbi:autoinducer binding domain-containing protein [Bradyrhizobium sp. CSA207]|uniref:autoinducer binding domain-containing protein n=1 Tax=Bradyrhizobium sp. CSA207 TaxID=2698826 RepID=UPI0031842086
MQPGEQRVLEEAREAGVRHGISVPLFGPAGRVSVVSFASRFDDADPQGHARRLNALAWHFHIAFAEIARPADGSCDRKVNLSEREKVA